MTEKGELKLRGSP
jgi:hypothetical protein